MKMSNVAKDFLDRHCNDWPLASQHAVSITFEIVRACVVSDPLVSYTSIDKVIRAHMYQDTVDGYWLLEVDGLNYTYWEGSDAKALLTLYNAEIAPTQIVYAVDHALPISALVGGITENVPFFSCDHLVVSDIESLVLWHPYQAKSCAALKIELRL